MSTNGQSLATRVLIIAGVRLFSESLAVALARRARVEVAGVAGDPVEGLQRNLDLQPEVVLLDVSMPQAVAAAQAILAAAPMAKVIALAVSEEDEDILAFAEAGISGYVNRDATLNDLVAVIESAIRGEVPCPPQLAAMLLKHISVLATRRQATLGGPHLTHRELEVIELIDLGLSNKEIAQRLCIEVPTVKNHVHRILDKLHVDRRAQAAAWMRTNEAHHLVRLRASRSGI